MLVLDSGGLSRLAERSTAGLALFNEIRNTGLWPPIVPTAVLVESLRGDPGSDAPTNRLLKTCDIVDVVSERLARRAAALRTQADRGSAVDALVVATAEPGGTILTSEPGDLEALAAHARNVRIQTV